MNAKILSYSRSKGVFAGLELKGATLNQDDDANKALYGKKIDAPDILAGSVTTPPAARIGTFSSCMNSVGIGRPRDAAAVMPSKATLRAPTAPIKTMRACLIAMVFFNSR